MTAEPTPQTTLDRFDPFVKVDQLHDNMVEYERAGQAYFDWRQAQVKAVQRRSDGLAVLLIAGSLAALMIAWMLF